MVQANGDMNRIIPKKKNKKEISEGLFHMLTPKMKNSLLIVARDDCQKLQKFDFPELKAVKEVYPGVHHKTDKWGHPVYYE